jgi:SanA protein
MRKRRGYIIVFLIIVITGLTLYLCDKAVVNAAKGKLYSSTLVIPFNKVGLLLGTGKYLAGGYLNPYYSNRIDAAVKLIKSGKIEYLILSGDNSRIEYNEPGQMKIDLMAAGVDSSVIYLDYAGFRTFDSIVRLKKIFGQQSVTIISQPFHNERAIYISSREGISAIGFNAKDVNQGFGLKVQVREKFARVKLFLDYLLRKEPKFLGDRVVIP